MKKVALILASLLIIVGAILWVEAQPPADPSEVARIAMALAVISSLLSISFFWTMWRKGSNFDFSTIYYYLRFVGTAHLSILLYFSVSFDWLESDQGRLLHWVILDTFLKGALFDAMESYNLDVSLFQPESHLFWWRTISFVFRSAYSCVFPAAAYLLIQRWKAMRRPR
jgi:hypothetical protein